MHGLSLAQHALNDQYQRDYEEEGHRNLYTKCPVSQKLPPRSLRDSRRNMKVGIRYCIGHCLHRNGSKRIGYYFVGLMRLPSSVEPYKVDKNDKRRTQYQVIPGRIQMFAIKKPARQRQHQPKSQSYLPLISSTTIKTPEGIIHLLHRAIKNILLFRPHIRLALNHRLPLYRPLAKVAKS